MNDFLKTGGLMVGFLAVLAFLPGSGIQLEIVGLLVAFLFWGIVLLYFTDNRQKISCDPDKLSWRNILRFKCDERDETLAPDDKVNFKQLSISDAFRISFTIAMLIGVLLVFRWAIRELLLSGLSVPKTVEADQSRFPQTLRFPLSGGFYENVKYM